ncbi:MAG TPA: hypothetical protein VIM70_02205 [Clostridium sp.]|uniref:hypothetical protein n=1 Tax=Clostridium sp. TaxID=1506 RepID=UPI002F9480CC
MKWILENANWIFSGIGVLVVSVVVGLFFKNKANRNITQSIKSGDNSINAQGVKNVTVTIGKKTNE